MSIVAQPETTAKQSTARHGKGFMIKACTMDES